MKYTQNVNILHCLGNATINETNSCYNPHPDLVQQPKEFLLDMINDRTLPHQISDVIIQNY